MQSLLVKNTRAPELHHLYSHLKVMETRNNYTGRIRYYIGTQYSQTGFEDDQITPKPPKSTFTLPCPGTRDSDYFDTAEEAHQALDKILTTKNKSSLYQSFSEQSVYPDYHP